MPIPIRAPAIPPIAPPTPTPVKAATIGPAAISGPTPGIASAPIPTSQPKAPPTTAPVVAPVAVPSGALVFFSTANPWCPCFLEKERRCRYYEIPPPEAGQPHTRHLPESDKVRMRRCFFRSLLVSSKPSIFAVRCLDIFGWQVLGWGWPLGEELKRQVFIYSQVIIPMFAVVG